MASSSSIYPVPTFAEWSMKMKDHLTSKGLWDIVKNGYKKPQPVKELNAEEMEKLKQNRDNDLEALFLINKSLGPSICYKICHATMAKEAWDFLHEIYQINDVARAAEALPSARPTRSTGRVEKSGTKRKINDVARAPEALPSARPTRATGRVEKSDKKRKMNEPPEASIGEPSAQPLRGTLSTNSEDNVNLDVVHTQTAVTRPVCLMKGNSRKNNMASSSSSSPAPTFSGEGFSEWSIKMKDHLISKGLWHLVKDGYKVPQSLETLNSEELGALQVNRINDLEAFLLLRMSLELRISLRISNAKTAKEAWDRLHEMFENNDASRAPEELPSARSTRRTSRVEKSQTKGDQNILSNVSKGGSSTEPTKTTEKTDHQVLAETMMNEPPRASNEGPSAQPPIRRTQNMPNSDNPQFDVVLTKATVRPSYILQFKARNAILLPSKNMTAVVRCRGENYAIMFHGASKQKGFGSGWKQLVDEHNLVKGDILRFEVVKGSSYELELKIHILSSDAPLEMQQETRGNSDHDDDGDDIGDDDDDIEVVDDEDEDIEYIDVVDDDDD